MEEFSVGWEEWLSFSSLGLPALKAKVDTGAKTSALHAFTVQPFGTEKRPRVRFGIHPIPDRPDIEIFCSTDVVDKREVTSSNGQTELRYVIKVPITMGSRTWDIEVTLTNRENMAYRMLLGRRALEGINVLPGESFIQPKLSYDLYNKLKRKTPVKRSLRIAILTRKPDNSANRMLIAAAEAHDHVIELIDTKRCYLNISSHKPEVHYDGAPLPYYDVVIPRIGASLTFYGMAVVRQFQAMGTYCLNSAESIGLSRDRLAVHQILARHRIAMPTTAYADSPSDTESLIKLVGGAPMLLKLIDSARSEETVLAETRQAAEAAISSFQKGDSHFIVQEFIKEAYGSGLRLFVVGRKIVAAMEWTSKSADYNKGLKRGGKAQKVATTREERSLVRKMVKLLGLQVAGVDIIRTKDGPKVLKVTCTPGLADIEKVTKKNIADKIIDHIERNVHPLFKSVK